MGSETKSKPLLEAISAPDRRFPSARYAALGLLLVAAICYQLRFTAEQFPGLWGHSDAPHRPFYSTASGDGPIRIYLTSQEAQKAGLQNGDILKTVNQKPAIGTAVFGEALAHARAGDILTVTVEHSGQTKPAEQTAAI